MASTITYTRIRLTRVWDAHRKPCLDCARLTHWRTQSQAFNGPDALRAYDNPVCGRITCG